MTMLSTHTGDASELVFVDPARALTPAGDKPQGWAEQDPILRDLWSKGATPEIIGAQLGRSVAAIMTRAARLGLPRRSAPGRKRVMRSPEEQRARQNQRTTLHRSSLFREALQPKEGAATRVCLMCVSPFQSAGRHNRICPKCKGSADYEAGARLPDIDF